MERRSKRDENGLTYVIVEATVVEKDVMRLSYDSRSVEDLHYQATHSQRKHTFRSFCSSSDTVLAFSSVCSTLSKPVLVESTAMVYASGEAIVLEFLHKVENSRLVQL